MVVLRQGTRLPESNACSCRRATDGASAAIATPAAGARLRGSKPRTPRGLAPWLQSLPPVPSSSETANANSASGSMLKPHEPIDRRVYARDLDGFASARALPGAGSSPLGFGMSISTLSVRSAGSRVPAVRVTRPSNARPGSCPTVTRALIMACRLATRLPGRVGERPPSAETAVFTPTRHCSTKPLG